MESLSRCICPTTTRRTSHVRYNEYRAIIDIQTGKVTAFDQVEDGSRYLPTAKKIFGDKFEAFKTINSDEKNRERLRAEGLATYAKKNGLSVTLYQDYGWPARKLED